MTAQRKFHYFWSSYSLYTLSTVYICQKNDFYFFLGNILQAVFCCFSWWIVSLFTVNFDIIVCGAVEQ